MVGTLWIDGHHLSVRAVPDPKLRTERHSKLKTDRKEAHDRGNQWCIYRLKGQILDRARGNFGATQPVLYRDINVQQWPPSWNLWVAVQISHNLQGLGAYCVSPLEATWLVISVIPCYWKVIRLAQKAHQGSRVSHREGHISWQPSLLQILHTTIHNRKLFGVHLQSADVYWHSLTYSYITASCSSQSPNTVNLHQFWKQHYQTL